MINLPRVKRCPCCDSINFIKVDGLTYENNFKTLAKWILKKKIKCRKCKEEIGYFSNNSSQEKLVWLNELMCEDYYFDKLNRLKELKAKLSKTLDQKYDQVVNEIQDIQEAIRNDKIRLKIKLKIQKRPGMFNRP